MAEALKENIEVAAASVAGTNDVVGPGSPMDVALHYQFVGFAFLMLILSNFFIQYSKNNDWVNSATDFRIIIFKLVAVALAFGFYMPSFYSLGREAWSLDNALQVLKPIVFYNVIAALAFKLLEPLQRCRVGAYTAFNDDGTFDITGDGSADLTRCRDTSGGQNGRSSTSSMKWTKFTDTLIQPILAILQSTVLIPMSPSDSNFEDLYLSNMSRGVKSGVKKGLTDPSDPDSTTNTPDNFVETLLTQFSESPLRLAVVLGLFFGLFHRAWMTPKDVIGGAAAASL
jgi:hypothetical protein